MGSVLIKDTTREEREKIVKGAIVVSMLDSQEPSQETKDMFKKYIDGEMEIEEIQQKIIKKFKRN